MKRRDALALPLASMMLGALPAYAQQWPSRPTTLIYPFGAGAGDVVARAMAAALEADFGTPVVVDAKPGAGGAIGGASVARARPDGYTLGYALSYNVAGMQHLVKNMPYDPMSAFEPVAWIGDFPWFLYVRKEVPATSVKELIAYAKSQPPEKLNMAMASQAAQILTAHLERDGGIKFTKVPYKTDPDTTNDVMGGRIDVFWATGQWMEHVTSGRLRAIAVSTTQRSAAAPDVPTLTEAGLQPSPVQVSIYVAAPTGTPKPIIERVNKVLNNAKGTRDDFKKAATFMRVVVAPNVTPDEVRARWMSEGAKWKEATEMAGIEKM